MNKLSQAEVLRRYPRIIAHLICQSLGYFTPLSAANAVSHFLDGSAFFCEWYCHMAGGFDQESVVQAGGYALRAAIRRRHSHKGCMAEYKHALALVKAEIESGGRTAHMLASWF